MLDGHPEVKIHFTLGAKLHFKTRLGRCTSAAVKPLLGCLENILDHLNFQMILELITVEFSEANRWLPRGCRAQLERPSVNY